MVPSNMCYLTQAELHSLSRNLPSRFSDQTFIDGSELSNLKGLLEDLFVVAEASQLSERHRAEAFNTLCSFIDYGSVCHSSPVQGLCSNIVVWNRMILLYMARPQEVHSKPMKQLLSTSTKLLLKLLPSSESVESSSVYSGLRNIVMACLSNIYGHDDLSFIKPSMLVLDSLLSKRFISAAFLAALTSVPASDPCDMNEGTTQECESSLLDERFLAFLVSVLHWAHHMDLAPSAGRLLQSFFESIKSARSVSSSPKMNRLWHIWLKPVSDTIRANAGMLESFERHVLPPLLELDVHETSELFNTLPWHNLLQGHTHELPEIDVRLTLLVIKITKELKMSLNYGRCSKI